MLLKDLTTLTASLASGTLFHVEKSGKAYNIDYTKLAKAIVEEYNGSTLGGSAQSVQAAIGALNSSLSISSEKISDKNITMYKSGHFGLLRIDNSFAQSASYVQAGKFTNMTSNNNFYYSYVSPSNGYKAKIKFGSDGTLSVMSPDGEIGIDCSFPVVLR